MRPFSASQESLGALVDASSQLPLRDSVLVADASALEALQWSGGLPFLLQNLQLRSVVDWAELAGAVAAGTSVATLVNPFFLSTKPNVLVLTCVPLDEAALVLRALVPHVVQLVVGSSLPEKAHTMSFAALQTSLQATDVRVHVVHIPLMYAPVCDKDGADPGLFVLTHPQCAAAFPLMRTQLPSSHWTHVNEIPPADIPEESRRAFKLLAQVLGGILMQWQFQAKDQIFALGATAVKVGHTLQHFLHELQGEYTTQELKQLQPATVVLIDRTLDLATPMSHQFSLVDRILQQLPKATTATPADHITQVAVLSTSAADPHHNLSVPVSWQGGVSLCPGQSRDAAANVRNLTCHGPVAALRELSTSLRAVAMELIRAKATPTPTKGAKEQLRGRDVVLRWLTCIDAAYDPKTTWQHKELLQLGVAVLETMARMDAQQSAWAHVASAEKRYAQSRFQGAAEWVLPEVADLELMQADPVLDAETIFQLAVYAFAIAGGHPIEDYTQGMVAQALRKALLRHDGSFAALPDDLRHNLAHPGTATEACGNDDEWDWDDGSNPPSPAATATDLATERAVDAYVARLLPECGQLYHEVAPELANEFARGLVPQVVSQLVDAACPAIAGLQHVSSRNRRRWIIVTDASEQLTRAGIDLLKSGLSVFGLRGQAPAAAQGASPHIKDPQHVCVVFVIGGITAHEVQAVADVLQARPDIQLVLGSTTLTTPATLARHLFQ
ncbi:hypothetical protein ACHHYP_14678 [Achlya hypogyna]|uniref:Uncharacterized protein n=1 Tax=Achlya hypogyna TaxID=1202772 RepID=A0A1V9YCN8_ACHHY|nr:hypothetical protein ACHHYP_14678 [Achlya hypogyna]